MNTYIGVIREIIDPDLYKIRVDVPGYNDGLLAYPTRGEIDEPRIGDTVFLRELDPEYHSYYLYERLKENNFIGIRSRGKSIRFNKDEIIIGIFDETAEWNDTNDGEIKTPSPTSWIKIDNKGNINMYSEKTMNVKVEGSCTVQSSQIDIKGPGTLTVHSSGVVPSFEGGPFWAGGPILPSEGSMGISGNVIILEE